MRIRNSLLLLLALAASVLLAAACHDGGNGGGGASSPTPSPSPFVPTNCQIVWVTNQATTNVIDYYLIDAPVATWAAGTSTAGFFQGDPTGATNITGGFVNDYDLVSRKAGAQMVATAGTYTMAMDATAPIATGASVQVNDPVAQHYFLLDTAGNLIADEGASGVGSFTGVWSAPEDPNIDPGVGTVSILFQGSSLNMGADYSFGQCYAANGFLPATRVEVLARAGARLADLRR